MSAILETGSIRKKILTKREANGKSPLMVEYEMKFLDEETIKDLEGIINVWKEVEHKRIKDISGADVDKWVEKTKVFVKKMQQLIVKIEILKREGIVEKSHQINAI